MATNVTLNKNYPYVIFTDKYEEIDTTGYAVNGEIPLFIKHIADNSKSITLPFEKIDYSEASVYKFGIIGYFDGDYKISTPLDMIINRSVLNNYASIINSQNIEEEDIDTIGYINYIEKVNKKYNFYDLLKFYKQTTLLHDNIINKYNNAESKYYQLYNDKDGEDYYAEKIWRAQPKVELKLLDDGKLAKKVPLFSCITEDENTNFYIRIRNFDIPMKRVLTGIDGIEYHYIFIYPEYIFKQYYNFSDCIQYIYTKSNPKVISLKYEGSEDAEWKYAEKSYDTLGNTQRANLS